jgi:hypothetical protein
MRMLRTISSSRCQDSRGEHQEDVKILRREFFVDDIAHWSTACLLPSVRMGSRLIVLLQDGYGSTYCRRARVDENPFRIVFLGAVSDYCPTARPRDTGECHERAAAHSRPPRSYRPGLGLTIHRFFDLPVMAAASIRPASSPLKLVRQHTAAEQRRRSCCRRCHPSCLTGFALVLKPEDNDAAYPLRLRMFGLTPPPKFIKLGRTKDHDGKLTNAFTAEIVKAAI